MMRQYLVYKEIISSFSIKVSCNNSTYIRMMIITYNLSFWSKSTILLNMLLKSICFFSPIMKLT